VGDGAVIGLVEVSRRLGVLWVCSYSQTVDGFWVMNGAIESLDDSTADERLGSSVLDMGRVSRLGVPTPTVAELSRPAPVVVAAGLRSYGVYLKGLRSVSVQFGVNSVRVVPQRNGGTKEGLVPIDHASVDLESLEPAIVGAGVRASLAEAI